eukprot:gnl/MRDRNA2_/MRDRNA2_242868_c0_seq1.p1 gnl/MRDRNA2_/MRDRNA2_242868_c0~~gnl/MRDRNA2_/MRDRNA2_242868_c0_seq1.p1  ORF type:complete len:117 (+),score=5.08 gnl/MRDRNA2_/MRDRNA2_242868_c0_seq1:50-352(+)
MSDTKPIVKNIVCQTWPVAIPHANAKKLLCLCILVNLNSQLTLVRKLMPSKIRHINFNFISSPLYTQNMFSSGLKWCEAMCAMIKGRTPAAFAVGLRVGR